MAATQRLVPRHALVRLALAVGVGVVSGFVGAAGRPLVIGGLFGWNASAVVLLVFSWLTIFSTDASVTQRRAGEEDPGRSAVYAIVVLGSVASVVAALALARRVKALPPEEGHVLTALSVVSVALAWLLTHTAFTLRYAHLYYREDREGVGGVDFPGGARPCYSDFAYVAFTVGMCFQVSDVAITSVQIRRAVLLHAMIAFSYNTLILALVLNLVFGMVS